MANDSELFAIEEAYRAALARLGIGGAYLALKNWSGVNPSSALQTGGPWLDRTLRMIQAIRWQSDRLAQAYYQYARAVETGVTLGLPDWAAGPGGVTLDGLRNHFVTILREIEGLGSAPPSTSNAEYRWFAQELLGADIDGTDGNARSVRLSDSELEAYITDLLRAAGDDRKVRVDSFSWPPGLSEDQIEKAFRSVLKKEALDSQAAKVKLAFGRDDLTPQDILALIEEHHLNSGSRGAGVADWAGVSAARDTVRGAADRDFRVKGTARQTGPNPCAFCAMLASRGFAYANEKSATTSVNAATGEIEKYHLNCHCTALVRWANVRDLPARSQFFKEQWPKVTKGKSGKDALNAWRRWIASGSAPIDS